MSHGMFPVLLRTRVSSRESNPNLQQFQPELRKLEIWGKPQKDEDNLDTNLKYEVPSGKHLHN